MTVRIFEDYESLSGAVAEFMLDIIRQKPDAAICVPSGETPKGAFRHFISLIRQQNTDLSRVTWIGLDEWVGISSDNPGSCGNFLQTWLFSQLEVNAASVHLFNGMADDLKEECHKMDSVIRALGGLDFILVGIGLNGHIGLNEPGVSPDLHAHVMELAPTTRQVGQKYFQEDTALTKGITLGLKHLLEAKTALLIANGEKKAAIIRSTVAGPISMDIPSTVMHKHGNGLIYVDMAAAGQLHNDS